MSGQVRTPDAWVRATPEGEVEHRLYLAKMDELVVAIDRLANAMSMWAGMFGPVANAILAFTEEYLELKEKVKP